MACKTCSSVCPECGSNRNEMVRKLVFDVVVRQAMDGGKWREVCSGPMLVNGIAVEEIEAEVERRKGNE